MSSCPIFLGFSTALDIRREAYLRGVDLQPSDWQSIPANHPTIANLRDAVAQVQRALPSLRLSPPIHYLVGSASRPHETPFFKAHSLVSRLPRRSFLHICENAYIVVPPLAFAQEAVSLSQSAILERGLELCGTYEREKDDLPTRYGIPAATNKAEITRFIQRGSHIRGTAKIAQLARYLTDRSASPRESQLALLTGLTYAKGGANFGMPTMNYEITCTPEARRISGRCTLRCDLCWPEAKLDIEYQSSEFHEGEANRVSDSRRANALIAMGFTVLGVTKQEMDSYASLEVIFTSAREKLEKRYRPTVPDYRKRQFELRRSLGLPC